MGAECHAKDQSALRGEGEGEGEGEGTSAK